MTRFLGIERWNFGQMYDGIGLEIWACADTRAALSSESEEDLPILRQQTPSDKDFTASSGGTSIGEGLNYWIPFLSAGSNSIGSEDLHHRSTLSYNHPNPFTSTTTLEFGLPRASLIGTAVYEEVALLANMMIDNLIDKRSGD